MKNETDRQKSLVITAIFDPCGRLGGTSPSLMEPDSTMTYGVGAAPLLSGLKISSFTFHSPLDCFFQISTYFPFSVMPCIDAWYVPVVEPTSPEAPSSALVRPNSRENPGVDDIFVRASRI